MEKFFVYIIRCEEGKYYIGSTEDIDKRLFQHNSKQFKAWTNRYTNWHLVYKEDFNNREDALKREKQIKSFKGGRAFHKLLIDSLGS